MPLHIQVWVVIWVLWVVLWVLKWETWVERQALVVFVPLAEKQPWMATREATWKQATKWVQCHQQAEMVYAQQVEKQPWAAVWAVWNRATKRDQCHQRVDKACARRVEKQPWVAVVQCLTWTKRKWAQIHRWQA